MKKWSILSRHIVLPEARGPTENLPVYGLVLIEEEKIRDVVVLPSDLRVRNRQTDEALGMYEAWNPVNWEDYYVSPGVIDCNVRGNGEWESLEEMTLAGVSGGVTLVVVENSLYNQPEVSGPCYCDVGRLARVDDLPTYPSPFAYKVYLSPPSAYVPGHADDLETVFQTLSDTKLPLIVDATMAQDRWLHISSPYRRRPLSDRVEGGLTHQPSSSGAYQKEIEDTDSSPDPESETESEEKKAKDDRALQGSAMRTRRFPMITVIVEEESKGRSTSFMRIDKRKRSLPTVMMDLRKRIYKHGQSVAELSKAEMKEYEQSGQTTYSPDLAASGTRKRSSSFMMPLLHAFANESSPESSPVLRPPPDIKTSLADRFSARRPQPLTISKPEVVSQDHEYLSYLVNSPDHWELDGVRSVLRMIKRWPRQIHFANLSAATAASRILRRPIQGVTMETCVHHLFFSMEEVSPGDTSLKAFPPIRNKTNCNLLWELLKMNGLTIISSQHVSVPPSLKFSGNFSRAVPGINGLGQALQAVWTKLRTPAIDSFLVQEKFLVRLAKWMSLNPARMLGVAEIRGSIEKGKYADLMVWMPFEKSGLGFVKHQQVCPYRGKELYGRVHAVYVRGQLAFQAGRVFPVGALVSPN